MTASYCAWLNIGGPRSVDVPDAVLAGQVLGVVGVRDVAQRVGDLRRRRRAFGAAGRDSIDDVVVRADHELEQSRFEAPERLVGDSGAQGAQLRALGPSVGAEGSAGCRCAACSADKTRSASSLTSPACPGGGWGRWTAPGAGAVRAAPSTSARLLSRCVVQKLHRALQGIVVGIQDRGPEPFGRDAFLPTVSDSDLG